MDDIKKLMNNFYARARAHVAAQVTASGKSQYEAKELLDVIKAIAVQMVSSEEDEDGEEKDDDEAGNENDQHNDQ
jgi:hypothetical protein